VVDVIFVVALGLALIAVLSWGVRTLPGEKWQMIAAVPVKKNHNGEWQGVNLTFYGFFSATASAFGTALMVVLAASVGTPLTVIVGLVVAMLVVCLPASRLIAWFVEGKRNTFTVAGAAFLGVVVLPPALWGAEKVLTARFNITICAVPLMAAVAIVYALSEAIGRMACLSFGCCYGKPIREANPYLANLFRRFAVVFHGDTKKVAYASGLAEESLIPVQTVTAIVFTGSGLIGLSLFLAGFFRAAGIIPAVATWGWRALSEYLRADYRGDQKTPAYQVMAVIAVCYSTAAFLLLPAGGPVPNIVVGLSQVTSASVIVFLQVLWLALFLYYGKSRVTRSIVSFHVVSDRV